MGYTDTHHAMTFLIFQLQPGMTVVPGTGLRGLFDVGNHQGTFLPLGTLRECTEEEDCRDCSRP
jgi:hypothetical protein